MGSDVTQTVKKLQDHCDVKANSSTCLELTKILNRISLILPAIESSRPGSTCGIAELCSLNNSIDKAKLLLQHCAESSKLYLAITGEATLSRCERIKVSLINSLCQIQDMVPPLLACKIAEVLDYLRVTKFKVDSPEEEAGRALLDLLRRTDSSEDVEFKAFHIAASRLKLTSSKAILIERRSLNKLLDKLNGSDKKKEKILYYLMYLLKKHGKNVRQDGSEFKENGKAGSESIIIDTNRARSTSSSSNNDAPSIRGEAPIDIRQAAVPPEEFCCPISSRLMYDPVVIASGQTYERKYIEKWFDEGHDTCPKTRRKLVNLAVVPNSCMKDLIANWCRRRGISVPEPCSDCSPADFCSWEPSHSYSISSLKNVSAALLDGSVRHYFLQNDHSNVSVLSSDASYCSDSSQISGIKSTQDNQTHLFSWSDDYQQHQSFSNFNHEMFLRFFYRLLELPIDVQDKAVKKVKFLLESDEEICCAMLANGFAEALISFLKNAREEANVRAIRAGNQLFLAFLNENWVKISSLTEDALQLLVSFLDSDIRMEVLMLMQKLAQNPSCRSSIMAPGVVAPIIKSLDSEDTGLLELSLKILLDLSADEDVKSSILSSGCITTLASFLTDGRLAHLCLKIIQNISRHEEGATTVVKAKACLAAIVELLDTGSKEEQEHAVDILYAICSKSYENCLLVMDEGVIPALVDINVNGNVKGQEIATRLLHLLRDVRRSDRFVNSYIKPESIPEPTVTVVQHSADRVPLSRSLGKVGKKLRFFSKSGSSTPC
ncbi:unnamed protein product [Musa acuminata subsp. burmannicoides]